MSSSTRNVQGEGHDGAGAHDPLQGRLVPGQPQPVRLAHVLQAADTPGCPVSVHRPRPDADPGPGTRVAGAHHHVPVGSGPSLKTSVLVRQVPADLGTALPQGSRVIGSVVTETPGPAFPAGTTVHFDRVLTQAGWKIFPRERPVTSPHAS